MRQVIHWHCAVAITIMRHCMFFTSQQSEIYHHRNPAHMPHDVASHTIRK